MQALPGVVSAIAGADVMFLATAIVLWQYGPGRLVLVAVAAIGSLLAPLLLRVLGSNLALFNGKIIMSLASVAGGIGAAIASEAVIERLIYVCSPMQASHVAIAGALLGGGMCVTILGVGTLMNVGDLWSTSEEISQGGTNLPKDAFRYFSLSLFSLVAGPMLGLIVCLIYFAGVGVHALDRWECIGVHFVVGTLVGLIYGIPYLLAGVFTQRVKHATRLCGSDKATSPERGRWPFSAWAGICILATMLVIIGLLLAQTGPPIRDGSIPRFVPRQEQESKPVSVEPETRNQERMALSRLGERAT